MDNWVITKFEDEIDLTWHRLRAPESNVSSTEDIFLEDQLHNNAF